MEITKIIILQVFIIFPFFGGLILKNLYHLKDSQSEKLSRFFIKTNLMIWEPLIIIWFIWKLNLEIHTAILPLSGILIVLIGFFVGLLFSKLIKNKKDQITFIINSSLANHGYTMGGIICFFLLGDEGLSKAIIFISYFYFYLYLFIFPYIMMQLNIQNQKINIKEILFDYRFIPFYALLIGLILSLFYHQKINFKNYDFYMNLIVYLSIIIYYFALSLNFKLYNIFNNFKEVLLQSLIKFIIVPFLTYIILRLQNLIPYTSIDFYVILIMSFMPSAIYGVISSLVFDLNISLSINIFIWTSLIFLVVVLPILYFFI